MLLPFLDFFLRHDRDGYYASLFRRKGLFDESTPEAKLRDDLELEDLVQREEQCIRATALLQIGKIDVNEVWRCHRHLELIDLAIKEQKNRVGEIRRRVDMLRMMLVGAERDRKVFEKLDEKEREEFFRSFLKHEQAVLDEVGLNAFVQREAHSRIHAP